MVSCAFSSCLFLFRKTENSLSINIFFLSRTKFLIMTSSSRLVIAATTVTLISITLSLFLCNDGYKSTDGDDVESEVIPLVGALGPESLAFHPVTGDGPYTGVSDGRIIKWNPTLRRWTDFAVTSPHRDDCQGSYDHEEKEHICGRPLGLRFNERTEDLYIADAYMGLLVVGPNGGLATKISTQSDNAPFYFANGLDIDQGTGVVYFTESSLNYQRRDHSSVIFSSDKTGRLSKYDPVSREVKVISNNLTFPNGVALSKNRDFVLIAETRNCRILKVWLDPSEMYGNIEIFAQLPGFPDNIKRNHNGEFWVAIHSRYDIFSRILLSYSWIGKILLKLPINLTKVVQYLMSFRGCGLAVRLSENGEILEMLEDKYGKNWMFASEVEESNGYLWIGSVHLPFVFKQKVV